MFRFYHDVAPERRNCAAFESDTTLGEYRGLNPESGGYECLPRECSPGSAPVCFNDLSGELKDKFQQGLDAEELGEINVEGMLFECDELGRYNDLAMFTEEAGVCGDGENINFVYDPQPDQPDLVGRGCVIPAHVSAECSLEDDTIL